MAGEATSSNTGALLGLSTNPSEQKGRRAAALTESMEPPISHQFPKSVESLRARVRHFYTTENKGPVTETWINANGLHFLNYFLFSTWAKKSSVAKFRKLILKFQ